ncbi:MAG: alpha-amylase, partial [Marmoricola sp.]|nr:alpha-amylase [Marmoricola sp.]
HTHRGRDGCRVPFPWEGDAPSYGFGPSDRSWLPQPPEYGALAVDRQTGHKDSTLELYRELLRLRRLLALGLGELTWVDDLPEHVVGFDVSTRDAGVVRVLANVGGDPLPLPAGCEVLVASGDVNGDLPTDTTVWLRGS